MEYFTIGKKNLYQKYFQSNCDILVLPIYPEWNVRNWEILQPNENIVTKTSMAKKEYLSDNKMRWSYHLSGKSIHKCL